MNFEWSEDENRCFGCGNNPWGLGLDFNQTDSGVEATTVLDENYQGFQNFAHGGIVVTLLDEAAGWAVVYHLEDQFDRQVAAPSYSLNCKIKKPVPLQQPIKIRAKVTNQRHKVLCAEAVVVQDKKVLAEGEIKSKIARGDSSE